MAVILDTGAVYALADADDAYHKQVKEVVTETNEILIIPAALLPEISYLV